MTASVCRRDEDHARESATRFFDVGIRLANDELITDYVRFELTDSDFIKYELYDYNYTFKERIKKRRN